MNLRKLKDSLHVFAGNWVYHSLEYQNKLDRQGVIGYGANKTNISNSDGVYTLLKIESVKNLDKKESIPPKDVQKFIKYNYQEIKGVKEMFQDLDDQFEKVLAQVAPQIKELYNTDVITCTLRTIESSSSLAHDWIQNMSTIHAGGLTWQFNTNTTFKKGNKPEFDAERYIEFVASKGTPKEEAEKKAKQLSKELDKYVEKCKQEGKKFTLHNSPFSGGTRTHLRDFVKGLVEFEESLEFTSIVDIVVDDFKTTGTTIKSMKHMLGITDGTVIAVCLFQTP